MTLRDVVVCIGGVFLGFIGCVLLVMLVITTIGEAFHVESMNITVALNQTQLEEAIRNAPGYRNASATQEVWTGSDEDIHKLRYIMATEYDRGFIAGIESMDSNILFVGSTFEYGNYTIKAQDMQPGKVYLEVIQAGNYIFNGTCYPNQWCNIHDISFQIDDIHIGKEAAYLVYWSDK